MKRSLFAGLIIAVLLLSLCSCSEEAKDKFWGTEDMPKMTIKNEIKSGKTTSLKKVDGWLQWEEFGFHADRKGKRDFVKVEVPGEKKFPLKEGRYLLQLHFYDLENVDTTVTVEGKKVKYVKTADGLEYRFSVGTPPKKEGK